MTVNKRTMLSECSAKIGPRTPSVEYHERRSTQTSRSGRHQAYRFSDDPTEVVVEKALEEVKLLVNVMIFADG